MTVKCKRRLVYTCAILIILPLSGCVYIPIIAAIWHQTKPVKIIKNVSNTQNTKNLPPESDSSKQATDGAES